jgi:hypothetical protein
MDRIKNYVPNDQVLSSELNAMQDRMLNVRRSSKDKELTEWTRTAHGIIHQQSTSTVGANSSLELDDGLDWRNRQIEGWVATLNNATDRINGSAAQYVNLYLRYAKRFVGFLGSGSTTTFDRAVGDFFIEVDWDDSTYTWVIYADASDGKLRIYNNTGSARRFIACVNAIGSET